MKMDDNNILPFLDILVMKRGPKLATKCTENLLMQVAIYFMPNYTHNVKGGVVHSLINRAKVVCQNQKDFGNEIQNVRYNVMLNEYPQDFITAGMRARMHTRREPQAVLTLVFLDSR
jgi:hypothetical protein